MQVAVGILICCLPGNISVAMQDVKQEKSMLNIYLADLTGLEDFYDEKVNMLHQERAEKLRAYKMPADRIRGLGAGLLLERGLEDYLTDLRANMEVAEQGNNNECSSYIIPKDKEGRCIIHYGYGPQGKPYLKDYPDIHFSLSHSGNMAVLAISDGEVGIDVQESRGFQEKVTKRFYQEEEIKRIEATEDIENKEKLFYQIWTGKEAYIKYTGKGMGQDIRSFFVDLDCGKILDGGQETAAYQSIDLEEENYFCGVVYDNLQVEIDKISRIIL